MDACTIYFHQETKNAICLKEKAYITHSNFESLKNKPFLEVRKASKNLVGVLMYSLKPS